MFHENTYLSGGSTGKMELCRYILQIRCFIMFGLSELGKSIQDNFFLVERASQCDFMVFDGAYLAIL